MSVRIGWSLTRPKERKPGKVAGGIYLFEFLKMNESRGRHLVVGSLTYTSEDLQQIREWGYRLDVRVIGLLRFTKDVTSELLQATINRIHVAGKISAPLQLEGHIRQLSI